MTTGLSALFRASSVALVGVSDRSVWSGYVLDGLDAFGFPGRVTLVNPRGGTVRGRPVVRSLAAADEPVELAYLMLPAERVPGALADAADAGVPHAIVLASGFGETGADGTAAEQDLVGLARRRGVRMLGPNALGLVNPHTRLALFPPLARHPAPAAGRVALVSQSGGIAAELLDVFAAADLGLSLLVCTGNEADVDLSEVLLAAADDPACEVVCVFVESVRRPAEFLAAVRAVVGTGRSVVVLKVGRSALAARTVAAHTGALVGDDRAVGAALRAAGAVRVDTPEQLVTTAALLLATGPRVRPGLASVGISGGSCSLIADAAHRHGVAVPPLSAATGEALAAVLPSFGRAQNPLDLTGAAVSDPALAVTALGALRRDPGVGLVLCQLPVPHDPPAGPDPVFTGIGGAAGPAAGLAPVVVCSGNPVDLRAGVATRLRGLGVPLVWGALDDVVAAAASVMRAGSALAVCTPVPDAGPPPQLPRPLDGPPWSEVEARELLARNGIPVVPGAVATSPAEAEAAAAAFGGPVAVKAVAAHLAHKTDVGAVELDVRPDEAAAAFGRVTAAAGTAEPVALLTPMRRGGVELIVGALRDPQWGPVLVVGAGGVHAELFGAAIVRLLPAARSDLDSMLDEPPLAALLAGPRGGPPADRARLVDVLVSFAALAVGLGPGLESIEINPLRVHGDRLEALDAAVAAARP